MAMVCPRADVCIVDVLMPPWDCPGGSGQKDLLLPDFRPRALAASLVLAQPESTDLQ